MSAVRFITLVLCLSMTVGFATGDSFLVVEGVYWRTTLAKDDLARRHGIRRLLPNSPTLISRPAIKGNLDSGI